MPHYYTFNNSNSLHTRLNQKSKKKLQKHNVYQSAFIILFHAKRTKFHFSIRKTKKKKEADYPSFVKTTILKFSSTQNPWRIGYDAGLGGTSSRLSMIGSCTWMDSNPEHSSFSCLVEECPCCLRSCSVQMYSHTTKRAIDSVKTDKNKKRLSPRLIISNCLKRKILCFNII